MIGSLTFIPLESNAESIDSDVNLTIEPVVALAVSPQPTLLLDLTPTPAGFEVAEEITVDVSTNNLTGYTLTMNAISNTTALTHTNGTNTMPSTTSLTAAALPTNNWGYNKGSGATAFLRIPPLATPDTLTITAAPITNDITIVTVGAKADINILPGVYSNTLVFTAVGNYVPASPLIIIVPTYPATFGGTITVIGTNFYAGGSINAVTNVTIGGTPCVSFSVTSDTLLTCMIPNLADGTYPVRVTTSNGVSNRNITATIQANPVYPTMQSFNTAACNAMPIYYPATLPPVGSEINLTDIRDGKVYKIRKLPSNTAGTAGWCWMVDNLALQPAPSSSIVLNSTDSDLVSGTYTLMAANVFDPNSYLGQTYCANLNTTTFPHRCGMQYIWTAATTGSTISTGSAPNSICPKNWRLPISGSTGGDFATLQTALAWGNSGANVNALNGWRGLYAGWNNGMTYQGTNGYYWSATASGVNNAYYLSYSASAVAPNYVGGGTMSTNAFSLRCLSR